VSSAAANYADIEAGRSWLESFGASVSVEQTAAVLVGSSTAASTHAFGLEVFDNPGFAKHVTVRELAGGVLVLPSNQTPNVYPGRAWALSAITGGQPTHKPPIANSNPNVDQTPTLTRCLRALVARGPVLSERQTLALRRQLRVLLSDEKELSEAGISVSVVSLHGLIDFLAGNDNKIHPNLSITRDGYFAASWSPRKRAKLTLVFKEAAAEWIAVDLDRARPATQKGSLSEIPPVIASWMTTVSEIPPVIASWMITA
jgi:hypothetical protein